MSLRPEHELEARDLVQALVLLPCRVSLGWSQQLVCPSRGRGRGPEDEVGALGWGARGEPVCPPVLSSRTQEGRGAQRRRAAGSY